MPRFAMGLHTLGQTPAGEQRIGLVLAMLRLDNGTVRSLRGAIAAMAGLDYQAILDAPGRAIRQRCQRFSRLPEVAVHRRRATSSTGSKTRRAGCWSSWTRAAGTRPPCTRWQPSDWAPADAEVCRTLTLCL